MREAARRRLGYGLAVVGGLAVVAAFLALGPPGLLAKSETSEFCASCHVMEPQYEAWLHSGAHRQLRCIDCHLPNQNAVEHYVWKGIDGLKDVVFFYGGITRDAGEIRASAHAERVLSGNCLRCHGSMLARVDTEGRRCWDCHRDVPHKGAGVL